MLLLKELNVLCAVAEGAEGLVKSISLFNSSTCRAFLSLAGRPHLVRCALPQLVIQCAQVAWLEMLPASLTANPTHRKRTQELQCSGAKRGVSS